MLATWLMVCSSGVMLWLAHAGYASVAAMTWWALVATGGLVVMAALCLAVLRGQSPLARGLALLGPVAAGLCMLAAIGWLRAWPG